MFSAQRLEEIVKILGNNGAADVKELSDRLRVTPKTIRKDLDKLEEMGLLERFHGGAILKPASNLNSADPFQFEQRRQKHRPEKERIAEAALRCIEEKDVIILDSGSTTLELAKRLGEKKIGVITNDLMIALELMNKENVTLYLCGGKLQRDEVFTLTGREARKNMERYRANKLFLSTGALDFGAGLMVFSEEEADMKKAMLSIANRVICLVDYSKFHKLGFITFAKFEDIDMIITDDRITDTDRSNILNRLIKLEIV